MQNNGGQGGESLPRFAFHSRELLGNVLPLQVRFGALGGKQARISHSRRRKCYILAILLVVGNRFSAMTVNHTEQEKEAKRMKVSRSKCRRYCDHFGENLRKMQKLSMPITASHQRSIRKTSYHKIRGQCIIMLVVTQQQRMIGFQPWPLVSTIS